MKKNVLLVTVAATALIAGASLASAQTMNTEQPKASAPMKSDSEKAGQSAQSPKKDADKAQTTGQAPKAGDAKKGEDAKKAQGSKPQTTGQAPKAEDTKKAPDSKPQTTGQAPREGQAQQPQQQQPAAQQGQSGTQQGQAGQAGGGAQAQLSTEQRTQIRQTVMQVGNAPRVSSVTFSLSVGTVVPRTVKYVPLPPRVVEIYPAWRGYHYFIVGDQIVIVESGSLRIVAVIPA
jgi:Protein of unknown function (DUF1236)